MDAIAAAASTDILAGTDFPALFRTYLLNGAEQALQQVRTHHALVQDTTARETVLHMLTFALECPAAYGMAREIVQRLTSAMEQAGLWELWIPYLHRAIKQCQAYQDPITEAHCCFWLGQLYQNQSKFPAAHVHWDAAVKLFSAIGDLLNQAKTLNRLAYLARLERRYADGEALVADALRLLAPDDPERAFSYFVQGVLAFDKQQWAIAVTHFQASLAISEQQGDKVTIARRLRNLGPALRASGQYAEAIACYERAITLFSEVYDPVQQAVTRMNLGVVYLLVEQPQQALQQFDEAEPIFRNAEDRWHLAMLYLNQGIAYRMQKAWPDAQHFCQASIALFQQVDNIEGEVNALEELGLTYADQEWFQQAGLTFQRGLELLSKMAQDPAYPALTKSISAHLQQVQSTEKISRGGPLRAPAKGRPYKRRDLILI